MAPPRLMWLVRWMEPERPTLDERNPEYIRETLPALRLFSSLYLRADVRSLGNVPAAGPVLLVGP